MNKDIEDLTKEELHKAINLARTNYKHLEILIPGLFPEYKAIKEMNDNEILILILNKQINYDNNFGLAWLRSLIYDDGSFYLDKDKNYFRFLSKGNI